MHGSTTIFRHPASSSRYLLLAIVALAVSASGYADNWPQWRGPTLDGISQETDLPVRWSTDENISWKLPMPQWSGSTPIIWGEHIFLNVATDANNLRLWSIDRTSGAIQWERFISGGNNKQRKQNMSSPSPVTDGEKVWVMTGTGILKAFDFEGNQLWSRDIQTDHGSFGLNWGYASSPLLYQDSLYVQVLHGMKTDDPSYILRIDKTSGETRWRVERPTDAISESPDSYTTPGLLRYGDRLEIVITGGDVVTGHDLDSGAELWRIDGLNPDNDPNYRIVASPVIAEGIVYAPTRVKPLLAIEARVANNTHRVWSTDNGPDVPTPVTDGEYFYVVNDRGIMWCFDAESGADIWGPERIRSGTYSGSPVLADGKIYVTNEDGVTSVVRAGPVFEILAENDLADYTLSSPAISGGQIFLRTAGYLYAIGERAGR